ncbi:MAG: hypothetical protein IT381_18950 [Deltaproteobacteria bacterium]|nr:hypothetical protein [Deltaproteobacteria bacterium]
MRRAFFGLLFVACAGVDPSSDPHQQATGPTSATGTTGTTQSTTGRFVTTFTAASATTQSAPAGALVTTPPAVVVKDQLGAPLAGIGVLFEVTAGGGSIASDVVSTDANGTATMPWTLGKANVAQTVRASLTGQSALPPITFTASVQTSYAITLVFVGTVGAAEQASLQAAAARWSAVITGDLPDTSIDRQTLPADCGHTNNSTMLAIDDVVIFADVSPIDGPAGLLATSGPCATRQSGAPAVGAITIDSADLALLAAKNLRDPVILHEMGHVLGVGAQWKMKNLVAAPSLPSSPGADTHFIGAQALQAFLAVGGTGYMGGQNVPLENNAVAASADTHWRESVLKNELMSTAIAEIEGSYPLSALTIASLSDLGFYTVNMAAADTFRVSFGAGRDGEAAPTCRVRTPTITLATAPSP